MGRSIPSFRQILEIEKLKMTPFNKILLTKKDKQGFDKIFDNVALYTSYLGNALNPVPLESVFIGAILHNYKQLLQITKEDTTIDESSLKDELASLLEGTLEGKILFYRFSKKWYGFIYSLHKEDRLILLKMVLEVCSYDENAINILDIQDSQSPIDYLFFLVSILLQQKQIDTLNAGETKKTRDITLLDFLAKCYNDWRYEGCSLSVALVTPLPQNELKDILEIIIFGVVLSSLIIQYITLSNYLKKISIKFGHVKEEL